MENKKWYAVYTRPRSEKKVADLLQKKKIENFCPLNKTIRQWADRKKIVYEPLFTSYVFVYISETEYVPVLQTDGVLDFVHWLKKPAVIKSEEIEVIKDFLTHHPNVTLEKMVVNVNDTVRITNGPLMMNEGNVIEVKRRTVKVYLPSLGYSMVADVEKQSIEVIANDKIIRKARGIWNARI